MRAVVGNTAGKVAELWDGKNHHALADETLVRLPGAPVRKQIRAGRGSVKIGFAHDLSKVASAHLAVGKCFAEGEPRCKLIGGEAEHNYARPGAFFEETVQTKVPVEIVRLLDRQTADFVLRGEFRVEAVHLHALKQERVSNEEDGRPAIGGKRTQMAR